MYKKIAGYWRQDKRLDDVIIDMCTECGHALEWIMSDDSAEGDIKLDHAWGKGEEYDEAFECDHVTTECEKCGEEFDLGYWYYNPETNNYDLCRPLMPKQAALAEAEAERQQQIAAGQLTFI